MMNFKFFTNTILAGTILASMSLSHSAFAGGGDYKPIVTGGITFFSGVDTGSLVGASEYYLCLTGETAGTYFRLTADADFGMASGTAYFTDGNATFSMYRASLNPGVNIFPFKDAPFQPFVGAKGILGVERFSMTDPPATTLLKSSQGFIYGWEAMIGTDLRAGKGDKGTALRIYGAVRSISASVAGQSSYDLGGFRMGGGLVF